MEKNKILIFILTMLFCLSSCSFNGIPTVSITETSQTLLDEESFSRNEGYVTEPSSEEKVITAQKDKNEAAATLPHVQTETTDRKNEETTGPENKSTVVAENTQTTETQTQQHYSEKETQQRDNEPDTTVVPVEVATAEPIKTSVCTITVKCDTVFNDPSLLKQSKMNFIPASGIILQKTEVEISGGDTVFDILKKACKENVCSASCAYCEKDGIRLEYTYTPAFSNYYIEGIHHLYEKDCGYMSGWMYSVNGMFPTAGVSSYSVKHGDDIAVMYTCNMGEDIGNMF